MKEFIPVSVFDQATFDKCLIGEDFYDLSKFGYSGGYKVSEKSSTAPKLYYAYDENLDEYQIMATKEDLIEFALNLDGSRAEVVVSPEKLLEAIENGGNIAVTEDMAPKANLNFAKDSVFEVNASISLGTNEIENSAELTIKGKGSIITEDGTALNSGKLIVESEGNLESTGGNLLMNNDNAEMIIKSGNLKSREATVLTSCKNSKVTIEGGSFEAVDNGCIMGNGTDGRNGNSIVVNGGDFKSGIVTEGYVACTVYCPNDDTITINDGNFEATKGCIVCARGGKVIINGGKFKTTGNVVGKVGDSKVVVPCSALVFDLRANYPGLTEESKIEVLGGEFISEVDPVQVVSADNTEIDYKRIVIKGGRFSADVSNYVPEGYKVVEVESGMFEVQPE